jgi:23S rRNA (cytidine1920-2'-O)/16S rRNA (cytidine1409-2'-O)-methyltransferase
VTSTRPRSRRRLDAELLRRGLAESRGRAAELVAAGRVLAGGAPATSPARRVTLDEPLTVTGPPRRFVSRGGEKLDAALDGFGIDVAGHRVLDAGASTGGFTDCLLQRGAAHVVAVDVGRGQLAWQLRSDSRVTVLDRTNVRSLEPHDIDGPVERAVVDLSFISLLTVAPALARCTATDAVVVALVKPQFEAGRARVGKGGIVRDPTVHRDVLVDVANGLAEVGLPVTAAIASPITGRDGNREFLVHVRRGAAPAPDDALAAIAEAVAEDHT